MVRYSFWSLLVFTRRERIRFLLPTITHVRVREIRGRLSSEMGRYRYIYCHILGPRIARRFGCHSPNVKPTKAPVLYYDLIFNFKFSPETCDTCYFVPQLLQKLRSAAKLQQLYASEFEIYSKVQRLNVLALLFGVRVTISRAMFS